jgi:DNA-binding winged helix-turn-helix (wHTH) protein
MNAHAFQRAETGWRIPSNVADEAAAAPRSIVFGEFEVLPAARALLEAGKPVDIGSRAFDLLMVLLAAPGEIISKEAIIREVWPTTTVDESNLRFQMTCLRRALGEERGRIKTIPGRGYLFIPDRTGEPADAARGAPRSNVEKSPIVIIEGNPEMRERLFRLLASSGARVEGFTSVASFLGSSALMPKMIRSSQGRD